VSRVKIPGTPSGRDIVDQIAPAAVGDITLRTNYEFVDPRLGPIELLYTFTQTGPATGGGGNPFIDNVFYVASDNDLSGLWSGIEIWNSPTSQAATWRVTIDDERIGSGSGGLYTEGLFTPTYGEPIMLRVRIDKFGTRARLWMVADPEPVAWTSQHLAATEITTPWDADWIVIQPRQTSRIGSQVFMLDEVRVIGGSRHGS